MSEITANRYSSSTIGYARETTRWRSNHCRRLSYGEYDTSQNLEDVQWLCPRRHSSQDKIWRNIQKCWCSFWYVYRKSTVKGEARMRRGQGIRRKVTGISKTPTNWRSFLRDDENKTESFQFLTDRICQTQTTSILLVTKEGCVICNDN